MSSHLKHTPGPWLADGFFVSTKDDEHSIVSAVISKPDEELKANAHLIAAAPDLLEACEAALKKLNSICQHSNAAHEAQTMIREAINKAKGLSS
ncbi:MAG: hypothetical protein CMF62_06285 [Magnetococcales bacterium]|nr:hypothetical protein [Magnetococcales bacterium]|tara:strand:+ start:292450 stop:292731 length:282 start_codon:yes stop_codon:yes gene_type:complete